MYIYFIELNTIRGTSEKIIMIGVMNEVVLGKLQPTQKCINLKPMDYHDVTHSNYKLPVRSRKLIGPTGVCVCVCVVRVDTEKASFELRPWGFFSTEKMFLYFTSILF